MNKQLDMRDPKSGKLSFGVFIIAFYFVFVFLLLPSNIFFAEDSGTRLPLFLGLLMVGIAVIKGRNIGRFPVPSLLTVIIGIGFITSGLWGPSGVAEAIRLFFAYIGIGLAVVLIVSKTEHLDFLFKTVMWVSIFNAVYGLLFSVPQLSFIADMFIGLGMPSGVTSLDSRLTGFISDPTYCGLMLMTGFFIALHEFAALRIRKSFSYATIIAVLLISIFATFSRTTWIATVFGLLVFTLLRKRVLTSRKLLLLCVVALSILVMNDFIFRMVETNIIRLNPQSSDSRTWIWSAYLKIALENPFGQGIGSIETIRYFATRAYSLTSTARPHNLFLIIWVESGIQTLIPFVALIILAIRYGWSVRNFADPISGKNYANVSVVILSALSIGVFGLGGMIQLVMLAIAMNIVVWLLAKEGKLVNRDEHMSPGFVGQNTRDITYRITW